MKAFAILTLLFVSLNLFAAKIELQQVAGEPQTLNSPLNLSQSRMISETGVTNPTTPSDTPQIVVLVPGFFNSFAPEYFSSDIIYSFARKGFKVYVIDSLNPLGTIEDNGQRLEQILLGIQKSENKKVEFNIIGHSAGGLYSLFVANRKKVEFKSILTVATPYKGVEFIDKWISNSILFDALTRLAHLDGLRQLTPAGVDKFIQSVRISPKTKIVAFGGYQPKSLNIFDARNMSVPLRVSSAFISGDSDGIVSYQSSLALGKILTTEDKPAIQFKAPNYFLGLEHWEQVLASDSFLFLGIYNTNYIRQEQIRFYSGLADLIHQL